MPKKQSKITDLFLGKYDREFLLLKLESDYLRLRKSKDLFDFKFSLIDFSIDVHHMAEWVWHDLIKQTPEGKQINETKFKQNIQKKFPNFSLFFELSNTAKHHTRNSKNKHVAQVSVRLDHLGKIDSPEILADCFTWIIGGKAVNALPVVTKKNGDNLPLLRVCADAITFWRNMLTDYK